VYIKCGEKHDKSFIANFLLNPAVKKIENRSTYASVMCECRVAWFSDSLYGNVNLKPTVVYEGLKLFTSQKLTMFINNGTASLIKKS